MQKEHFEILLESVDSKINLILEGFSVLNKKIEDERAERKEDNVLLNEKISALSKRFDGVDSRLDGIDARLDGIDARLDGIDARLDGIDARLDDMTSELTAHRNSTELHKVPRKREVRKAA